MLEGGEDIEENALFICRVVQRNLETSIVIGSALFRVVNNGIQ